MKARAARLVKHGEPLRIEDVELPEPADDEVLLELHYGGVNPVDLYGADGRVAPDEALPRTLGTEGSGRAGDRNVVVHGHGLGRTRDGVWASAAVVPKASVVEAPESIDLEAAATLGIAGATAWRTVHEYAQVSQGDRVLVFGATGGVGSMIVSLVKSLGATVWGQTTDPSKKDFVLAQGAEEVVVTDSAGLAEAVRSLSPSVVFDGLGDGYTGAVIPAMALHGRLVIFGASAGPSGEIPLLALYRNDLTIYGFGGLVASEEDTARGIRGALDALASGSLRVECSAPVPLAQVNEAMARLARHDVRGKLVLDVRA
jgi:NADPH:quinone reductase